MNSDDDEEEEEWLESSVIVTSRTCYMIEEGGTLGELRKQGAAEDTNDILEMFELCQ